MDNDEYKITNCHIADGDDSIKVKNGDFVLAGKYLGKKGNTGTLLSRVVNGEREYYQMNDHLHYEVRLNGSNIDPNYTFIPDHVSSHDSY